MKTRLPFRRVLLCLLYGLLLSLAITYGHQLETLNHLDLSDEKSFLLCLLLTGLFFPCSLLLMRFLDFVAERSALSPAPKSTLSSIAAPKSTLSSIAAPKKLSSVGAQTTSPSFKPSDRIPLSSGVLSFLCLFLSHFTVLLGVYPGFFVYDTSEMLQQVITRSFQDHHPLIHTLFMGGTIKAVEKLSGSWNTGIFVYTFLQMIVIDLIFTEILLWLKKCGVKRCFRLFSLLYLSLFPPVVMFVLCASKDGLFNAFFLLFLTQIADFLFFPSSFCRKKKTLLFVGTATLFLLYRKNALYAYLLFVLICLFLLLRNRRFLNTRKAPAPSVLALLLCLPLMLSTSTNSLLVKALHAQSGEHQEVLSVPIMQLARVYQDSPSHFSPEEKKTLYRYLPEENLKQYTPRLSDRVKLGFQNAAYDKDKTPFLLLWLHTVQKHPLTCLNALLLTSYGNWYPFAVNNVYKGNTTFTFTYRDSSYFGYETEAPGSRQSKIPVIDRFYRLLSIEKSIQNIPVVSLLFAPAFYFQFWFFVFLYLCAQKKHTLFLRTLILLPVFFYWLTLLLGPTYLPRYGVILFDLIPLLPIFFLNPDISTKPDNKEKTGSGI